MHREDCSGFDISSAELFSNEVREFRELLVKKFDIHCNSGLYTPRL